jgi:hypothetical protein
MYFYGDYGARHWKAKLDVKKYVEATNIFVSAF